MGHTVHGAMWNDVFQVRALSGNILERRAGWFELHRGVAVPERRSTAQVVTFRVISFCTTLSQCL